MTFGLRDGAPFFHCHALWTEADGKRAADTSCRTGRRSPSPCARAASGSTGAGFSAQPDPETNFTLFGPCGARGGATRMGRVFALRLRPNQDLSARWRVSAARTA